MNLLLDTHVFVWWRTDNRQLRAAAREAIIAADTVWVSAASAWEVAIKAGTGRFKLQGEFEAGVEESGFAKLQITFRHATAVAALPAHHRDPFDRLLIAQAQVEGLTIVTHDRYYEPYGLPLVWT